jgi:hypothetical protein
MLINSDNFSLLGISSRRFSQPSSQKVRTAAGLQPSEVCVRFLDPMIVNEKTCRGDLGYDKAHMTDVVTTTVKGFVKQGKTNIFLAYNCEYVFSSFILVITAVFFKILIRTL